MRLRKQQKLQKDSNKIILRFTKVLLQVVKQLLTKVKISIQKAQIVALHNKKKTSDKSLKKKAITQLAKACTTLTYSKDFTPKLSIKNRTNNKKKNSKSSTN